MNLNPFAHFKWTDRKKAVLAIGGAVAGLGATAYFARKQAAANAANAAAAAQQQQQYEQQLLAGLSGEQPASGGGGGGGANGVTYGGSIYPGSTSSSSGSSGSSSGSTTAAKGNPALAKAGQGAAAAPVVPRSPWAIAGLDPPVRGVHPAAPASPATTGRSYLPAVANPSLSHTAPHAAAPG